MSDAAPEPSTLIVTHDGADFDAVASQMAVRRLYPGATLLSSPSVGRDVHPYLALHKDRVAGCSAAEVDWSSVGRLVVVDVRRRARLGHIRPLLERLDAAPESLEVVIYDHHPASPDDVMGDEEHVEPVGSTTTLLVEQIQRAGLTLDRVEATLLALGLHTDTGSLTFVNATARDARALAVLLEFGAEAQVLARYLHAPLDALRRSLLSAVLEATELHVFGGLSVGIATIDAPNKTTGLDEITSRAHELCGYHALFALYVRRSGKLHVIGRSRAPALDVAATLGALGGGGHASAGAASVAGVAPAKVEALLLERLRSQPLPALTARDLMTSPVHAVDVETAITELERSLERWQHSGACVLRDGRLAGVVSRADVSRARGLGQLHFKVKSLIARRPITTEPGAPLEQLMALMEEHDIGRLPVIERERLIGIVSRSDVRRALYGER